MLLLMGIQHAVYSQLDTNQETFRIKALALEKNDLSVVAPICVGKIMVLVFQV